MVENPYLFNKNVNTLCKNDYIFFKERIYNNKNIHNFTEYHKVIATGSILYYQDLFNQNFTEYHKVIATNSILLTVNIYFSNSATAVQIKKSILSPLFIEVLHISFASQHITFPNIEIEYRLEYMVHSVWLKEKILQKGVKYLCVIVSTISSHMETLCSCFV